jgi:hypothetical protein
MLFGRVHRPAGVLAGVGWLGWAFVVLLHVVSFLVMGDA